MYILRNIKSCFLLPQVEYKIFPTVQKVSRYSFIVNSLLNPDLIFVLVVLPFPEYHTIHSLCV